MNPSEPPTDVPSPTPSNEEIVDPALPAGSHQIVVIRRHPFGLVALILQVGIGLGIAFSLIFFLVPSVLAGTDPDRISSIRSGLMLATVIVGAIAAIFLLIAAALYRQNRWVISDDSITQVLRAGLFNFNTSGLSMANIEDVTSLRKGIFANLFGFGILKVETAGEHSNFHFFYCPTPDMYAKILLDARERFIEGDPGRAERANEKLNAPRGVQN